jgi:DNA-binding NarL/FixJ family response regulator
MDPPPVQYVTTSDAYNIAYSVCGAGPTLLLMPFPVSHLHLRWQHDPDFIQPFVGRFRLVQFDPRGQGMSSRGLRETHSHIDYVRDVAAVASTLQLAGTAVWADVFQCDVAVRFAIEYPERVGALILRNPRIEWTSSVAIHMETLARQDWETFLQVASQALLPFASKQTDILSQSVTQADWLARVQAIKQADLSSEVQKISCPVLVLATTDGTTTDQEDEALRFASLLPQSRLLIVRNNDFKGRHAQIAEEFIAEVLRPHTSSARSSSLLSSRELDVLGLIAAGKSNQQIADALVISINTVARHVANILGKTGAANRTEAAVYARDKGLI